MKLLQVDGNRIHSVSFSPDSSMIALSVKTQIELWEWHLDRNIKTIGVRRSRSAYHFCHFNSSGRSIFACQGGSAQEMDLYGIMLRSGWGGTQAIGSFRDEERNYFYVAISDPLSKNQIRLHFGVGELPHVLLGIEGFPFHFQYLPKTNQLIVLAENCNVCSRYEFPVPNPDPPTVIEELIEGPQRSVWKQLFRPTPTPQKRQKVIHQARQLYLKPRKVEPLGCNRGSCNFSPDGEKYLMGSHHGKVQLWDSRDQRRIDEWVFPIGYVHSVAFSWDGVMAIAGGDKGRIVIWDLP